MRKRPIALVILSLIFVVAACTPATSTPTAPEAASEAAPTTAATTAPTEAPTDAPTATPVPPTETPVPPTPTPVPPTATPESAGLTTEAGGTCAHPYFPIRSDRAWTYDLFVDGSQTGSYTLTYEDITAEAFTAIQTFEEDLQTEVRWLCDDDGLMSSIFANVSFAQISNFEYETLDYEGVILLPEEEWETGAAWSTRYVVNATATIEGMTIDTQMDIVLDHTLAAFEEVTVPAGTFDAARVDSTGTFKMTSPVAMEINFPYTIWYAEGIGMVRVYGENEFGTSRVALASLTTSE
jgi:hypothetical protein